MKKLNFVIAVGLIFFLFPLAAFIPETIREIEVWKRGKIVKARIVKMPSNCLAKRKFARFSYDGYEFNKRVSRDFCELHKHGDRIDLIHLDAESETFLVPGSSDRFVADIISSLMLSMLGLLLIAYNQKILFRLRR